MLNIVLRLFRGAIRANPSQTTWSTSGGRTDPELGHAFSNFLERTLLDLANATSGNSELLTDLRVGLQSTIINGRFHT